jgi:hypothetical protein
VKQGLVNGPIVTTRSTKDTAVGRFYPLGAKLKKQLVLADTKYPKYGGIGSFGIQGVAVAEDLQMQSSQHAYGFRGGRVYNLEASRVIRNGGGASGAHSDIAHPEVAHAFWAAVLADQARPAGTLSAPPPSPPSTPSVGPPPPRARRAARRTRGRPEVFGSTEMEDERTTTVAPRWEEEAIAATRRQRELPEPATLRWFNAELEDHAPDAPLAVGRWYTLAVDVDVVKRETAIATSGVDESGLFTDDGDEVTLTVQLDSADFEITDHTRPLRLPRAGRSRGKARFDISPQHDGPSSIRMTIHKEGNFIQQMDLTFSVGAKRPTAVDVTRKGRPPSAAAVVHPRDVGLSVQPAPAGGYDCIVWGAVASRARLSIQQAHLASAIETVLRSTVG